MENENCENCNFRIRIGKDNECRRFPPQLMYVGADYQDSDIVRAWPNIELDDWCGEWKFDVSE